MRFVSHDSTAADSSHYLRITRVPTDVTLSDETTNTIYRLVGANSAGGNISVVTGRFEFTAVSFFNILAPNGGVVGKDRPLSCTCPPAAATSSSSPSVRPRRTSCGEPPSRQERCDPPEAGVWIAAVHALARDDEHEHH